MKKLFTLIAAVTLGSLANAQIASFPNNEGFETSFVTGTNTEFIPNWTGNEVSFGTRIFADSLHPRTGLRALGMIPTTTFSGEVIVDLDLTGISNLTMSLWAKSETNGTGTREAIVYISTSTDGGVTYGPQSQLGDSTSFPNASTSYANYIYAFAPNTNNQPDVRMKITVTRGNGTTGGTAALFIMDDLMFSASAVDLFPPDAISATALSTSTIQVVFSEAVGISADNTANYTGIPGLTSAVRNVTNDVVTLTFGTPMTEGDFYTLTVQNVADAAGNIMTTAQNFVIIFNDNTGNVKITEIMYNNAGAGIDSLEFIEVHNGETQPIVIGGWQFTSGITYTMPSGTIIGAGEFKVFSRFASVVDNFFSITSTPWDATQALSNTGETIVLQNASGTLIDSVAFLSVSPWDTMANGYGPSLVLCDLNTDNDFEYNWRASVDYKGLFQADSIPPADPVYASPGTGCLTVGITESPASQKELMVMPNPSNGIFAIGLNETVHAGLSYRIIDISGRVVMNGVISGAEGLFSIHAESLKAGIYMLSIGDNAMLNTRIVIN